MLRAAHTLFDTASLAAWAAETYGLIVTSCRFHRSFVNDTYAVEAGRRYYLRVSQHGWRDRAAVEGELDAIEALHRAGARVARPVALAGLDASYVAEVDAPEGPRAVVLFEEAPGVELGFWGADGLANARRYGRVVADVHAAAVDVGPPRGRPPMGIEALIDTPIATVGSRLGADDRVFLAHLADRLRLRVTMDLTFGFCHGDLNTTNVHFPIAAAGDDSATVFDFDCCHWGWVANDIAGFARGITLGRTPGEPVTAYARRLVEWLRVWEVTLEGGFLGP